MSALPQKLDKRVMLLTRQHMQRIVNSKAATPFAQRNFLNTLRAMFKWAMKEGRIPDDPTLGVTREKVKTTGYRTWSEREIERFEAALSNLEIRLDNSGAKMLITNKHKKRMVGPGGLEPPTKRL